ncbi:ABC transporter permease [Desulfonatronovibrio hydrogenovorans]|uniref:ABC transporter permease n=1 Tax=Desulfonatronovibrio hydrogenovorans TaxID=53245 RepID=UPI00048FD84E|nr:ABC transporter permease [Desulfonatronovibrio hydrogenovorans]
MSVAFVCNLGRAFLDRFQTYNQAWSILARSMSSFFRLALFNRAVSHVFAREVYHTAYRSLPVTFLASLIIGAIVVTYLVSLLTRFGAYEFIGEYIVTVNLHEVGPIICSIIVLLKSGSRVVSDVAQMKINRELNTLYYLNIPVDRYLMMPMILAFAFAGPCLNLLFGVVSIIGGFLVLGYLHDLTFANYLGMIGTALDLETFFVAFFKPMLMCIAVAAVSIQKGMSVNYSLTEVPVRLIQGLMHVIGLIILIELVFVLGYLW